MLAINCMFNRVHEWGEANRPPVNRILLTRLGTMAGAGIESLTIAFGSLNVGVKLGDIVTKYSMKTFSKLFPKSRFAANLPKSAASFNKVKDNLLLVSKLIIGLASSLLLGILFTPELNFRIHLKLGLIVDNLDIRKQKEQKATLDAEVKAAEITRLRANRYAQFQSQRQAAKNAEEKENAIDTNLAVLLRHCR